MQTAPTVFVNYRRGDDAYAAAFLDDALSREFGPDRIFRAGRSIPAGQDYEHCIMKAIESASIVLVLMGPNWAESLKSGDRKNDWVSKEIAEAFERKIPVVPILLSGASRIAEDYLPSDLAPLARLQYLRFDYRNTFQDLTHIANELRRAVPELT